MIRPLPSEMSDTMNPVEPSGLLLTIRDPFQLSCAVSAVNTSWPTSFIIGTVDCNQGESFATTATVPPRTPPVTAAPPNKNFLRPLGLSSANTSLPRFRAHITVRTILVTTAIAKAMEGAKGTIDLSMPSMTSYSHAPSPK